MKKEYMTPELEVILFETFGAVMTDGLGSEIDNGEGNEPWGDPILDEDKWIAWGGNPYDEPIA